MLWRPPASGKNFRDFDGYELSRLNGPILETALTELQTFLVAQIST
jgi:hypothetical protein